ncbi:MAG: TIGR02757 family protein [Saprospiraceae bacterium]|nr:TIGR02757 family protein [Saprospiraceae bacterium]
MLSIPSDNESIRKFLDEYIEKVNVPDFIEKDPISIPHRFSQKQDIEIAAFFAAIFAWGNRTTIINKTSELLTLMDNDPYNFIVHHNERERKKFLSFKHRTFQITDTLYFLEFLQHHYQNNNTLEHAFMNQSDLEYDQETALIHFHNYFFSLEYAPQRTKKHISTPANKSTCKRLNMFLRWMVRKDNSGVDFGLWHQIPAKKLMIPLDVHVEKVARSLGLIERKQSDWLTVKELTNRLSEFDNEDPVKYDFALFGLGVMKII